MNIKYRAGMFGNLFSISFLISTCLVFQVFHFAKAVPATPELLGFSQPDGTKIQLHLRGDEYFSWHESADGYVVVKDQPDGYWKYARPVAGQVEFRAVAGARVGTADPKLLGLTKRMLPEAKFSVPMCRLCRNCWMAKLGCNHHPSWSPSRPSFLPAESARRFLCQAPRP